MCPSQRRFIESSNTSNNYHAQRSLAIREANRQRKSKACPELVEGDLVPSCGAPGNDEGSQVSLGFRRAGRT